MKWKLLGGAFLVAAAAGVIFNLRDLRRYVRISMM
jgi:hypothetical protein